MSVFRGPRWSVGPDWVLVPFAVPQPEPDRATLRAGAALAGVTCGWIYGLYPPVPPLPGVGFADSAGPGAHRAWLVITLASLQRLESTSF